ncbi:MAG: hypothetical protein M1823_005706 [Watsoniomyces obsoletus]|nr:MAG: hypothetical protein M1823_005706 [Watsoniomyces obsoletus]
MTTPAVDAKSLKTWEDAFQYPIPAVRRMEQQLRREHAGNAEKLRQLVGASYRDLLGTAEMIIKMDEDMQQVESSLSDISGKCNSRVLENIMKNHTIFEQRMKASEIDRCALASQLHLFQSCPRVIARLLRNCGSNLLAAKLLVICRLLYKTLSQHPNCPPLVDVVRDRLASLRGKLLRRLEGQFADEGLSDSALLNDMCAFLLATSSAPTDLLRHFLHTRHERIKRLLENGTEDSSSITKAMKLYLRTIEQTLGLFPTRLASILITFRSRPLLEDPEMKELGMFHLDLEKSWLPEEIRNFTPWLRHDVLEKRGVESVVGAWADSTFDALRSGLRSSLDTILDPWTVTKLRRALLETWLGHGVKNWEKKGQDRLEKLRLLFVDRLTQLVKGRATKLEAVGYRVVTLLQSWGDEDEGTKDGLWSASTRSKTLGIGAVKFKNLVLDRLHGHDIKHRRVMKQYSSWLRQMQVITDLIKHLKEEDWEDDLDLEMEESDLESTNSQLREEDPRLIQDSLGNSITSALKDLDGSLYDTVKLLVPEYKHQQAAFLLRIIRDIRQQLPESETSHFFGVSTIPELHDIIVEHNIDEPVRVFEQRMEVQGPTRLKQIVALWEGTPLLPTQPSPAVFKLLHDLVTAMAEEGGDLWASAATRVLKKGVRRRVAKCFRTWRTLAGGEEQSDARADVSRDDPAQSPPASDAKDDESESEGYDDMKVKAKVQELFDVMFLQEVLAIPGPDRGGRDPMDILEEELVKGLKEGVLDIGSLRVNVQGFWKRTALLSSLLV